MIFVLTTAGQAAVAASPGVPVVLAGYTLGSSFGYAPNVAQTAIVGTAQNSGVPSLPIISSNNLVKYVITLGTNTGPFTFGEVGLYLPGNVLFAIGVESTLITKTVTAGVVTGNNLTIDCYLSTVGTNYAIFAELGNSNQPLNLLALPGVDSLPAATSAFPNIFLVTSPDLANSTLAFSNNAIWSIGGYEEIVATGLVNSSTALTVTSNVALPAPFFVGELLLQFTSGPNLGIVRNITSYLTLSKTVTFANLITTLPNVNDTFQIIKKTLLRPYLSAIINGLSPTLTSGDVNSLVTNPLSGMIKKDGTVAMTAPLNLAGFKIVNVSDPALSNDAATKNYVDIVAGTYAASITALNSQVAVLTTTYIRRDGSIAMTGTLPMGGFRVVNLGTPTAVGDATTKGYVDSAVSGISASIITNHNALSGIQGGAAGSYYHLTLAEQAFVSNLVLTGYPAASYSTAGISSFATALEVSLGISNSKGIAPESLVLALAATGGPSPLQASIIAAVNTYGASVQFGAGAPIAATVTTPPLYFDTATNPFTEYVYQGLVWNPVNPVSTTTQVGVIRIATSAEVTAGTSNTTAVTPQTLTAAITSVKPGISATLLQLATVSQNDVVRYSATGYAKAIADSTVNDLAIGIADVTNLLIQSTGVISGFTGLTPYANYFLSDTIAGAITTVAPSDSVRVGIAKSATELFIDIDPGASSTSTQPTGGGTDKIFFTNSTVTTASYTIPVGKNAHVVGPLTVALGNTITVSPGSRWITI